MSCKIGLSDTERFNPARGILPSPGEPAEEACLRKGCGDGLVTRPMSKGIHRNDGLIPISVTPLHVGPWSGIALGSHSQIEGYRGPLTALCQQRNFLRARLAGTPLENISLPLHRPANATAAFADRASERSCWFTPSMPGML